MKRMAYINSTKIIKRGRGKKREGGSKLGRFRLTPRTRPSTLTLKSCPDEGSHVISFPKVSWPFILSAEQKLILRQILVPCFKRGRKKRNIESCLPDSAKLSSLVKYKYASLYKWLLVRLLDPPFQVTVYRLRFLFFYFFCNCQFFQGDRVSLFHFCNMITLTLTQFPI